jgi:hypothetical protein
MGHGEGGRPYRTARSPGSVISAILSRNDCYAANPLR